MASRHLICSNAALRQLVMHTSMHCSTRFHNTTHFACAAQVSQSWIHDHDPAFSQRHSSGLCQAVQLCRVGADHHSPVCHLHGFMVAHTIDLLSFLDCMEHQVSCVSIIASLLSCTFVKPWPLRCIHITHHTSQTFLARAALVMLTGTACIPRICYWMESDAFCTSHVRLAKSVSGRDVQHLSLQR